MLTYSMVGINGGGIAVTQIGAHTQNTGETVQGKKLVKGWYSRGYLPHFDGSDTVQMVTFRLADSFPQHLLAAWRDELACLSESEQDSTRQRRIEDYLDRGAGAAWLCNERVAALVQDALLYFDGPRYRLHAWVIMPNHVHARLTPMAGYPLPDIMHSWKSYTAKAANRLLRKTGDFWHREYFDRYIRNDKHYVMAVTYIEGNPVRAGLCASVEEWPWSSGARTHAAP